MTPTNPTEVEARARAEARRRAHEILGLPPDEGCIVVTVHPDGLCYRVTAMVIAFDEKCDRLTEVQREATALRAEVARLTAERDEARADVDKALLGSSRLIDALREERDALRKAPR